MSNTSGGSGVLGSNTASGTAIFGTNTADGNAAIFGENGGSGPGVYGVSLGSNAQSYRAGVVGSGIIGVFGRGIDTALFGQGLSSGATGVFGGAVSGIGVYGTTSTPTGGQAAVLGVNSGPGPGVVGFSAGGPGLSGGTGTGMGLAGIAASTGNGVVGQSAGGNAVTGIATGASNLAGLFQGPVWITGGLAVMGAKNAVVRGADGDLHRLYCVESPESWFEDFGSGQLSTGTAIVQLDPGFAEVVKTEQYHVYALPNGDCKGLYVSNKTPTSFTVHELQGGTSSIAFDYRIVAKRKDIEGTRLEHVDEPPTVQLLKLPELPATPPIPPVPTPTGHGG
jgi:hypothetical protein